MARGYVFSFEGHEDALSLIGWLREHCEYTKNH